MLSITTVLRIIIPPTTFLKFGISFNKITLIMIPKSGWILLIILAVLILKCEKLERKSVWPNAVVINPNISKYGKSG